MRYTNNTRASSVNAIIYLLLHISVFVVDCCCRVVELLYCVLLLLQYYL